MVTPSEDQDMPLMDSMKGPLDHTVAAALPSKDGGTFVDTDVEGARIGSIWLVRVNLGRR